MSPEDLVRPLTCGRLAGNVRCFFLERELSCCCRGLFSLGVAGLPPILHLAHMPRDLACENKSV